MQGGGAHVRQLGAPLAREQHVFGLQVPVHHVVGMQVCQPGGNVKCHLPAALPPPQLSAAVARQRGAQVAALWSVMQQGGCWFE